jgi:dynein heavy chain
MLDLKTDLQNMYMRAGCKDEGICFLFTEGQITKEQFLVFINDLLSSGEIADLFDSDGVDTIVGNVFTAVKGEGIVPSKDNSWRYFINRVRKNLHMSLCFSPVGDAFRNRARKFPALVNATVIDWFHPWPQEALLSVANKFLEETEMPSDEVRKAVVSFLPFSFTEVQKLSEEVLVKDRRYIYTTPKSFLELIGLFKGMLDKKKGNLESELEKYQNGVNRLQYTTAKVGDLEAEIKEMAVVVQAAKSEAQEQAAIVSKEKAIVDAQNDIATVEKAKADKVAEVVSAKKASVEADLAAAEPLVLKAQAALDSLKEDDFKMLKAFANPPAAIKMCLETVLHLFATIEKSIAVDKKGKVKEEKPWPKLLQLMGKPKDFLALLMTLKKYIDEGTMPA